MATITLYEKNGVKRGNPINGATFEQVLWNPQKQEYFVTLVADKDFNFPNVFRVSLGAYPSGEIRISALGRNGRLQIDNSGTYEFWL